MRLDASGSRLRTISHIAKTGRRRRRTMAMVLNHVQPVFVLRLVMLGRLFTAYVFFAAMQVIAQQPKCVLDGTAEQRRSDRLCSTRCECDLRACR